jgi:ABC-type lipoprotein release transport system permease subunit
LFILKNLVNPILSKIYCMSFFDILHLALRNLRQAKLRAILTTMGVIVGVAVIVTMVSFGLGLQRNMLGRFRALDFFNEIQVFGQGLSNLAGLDRSSRGMEGEQRRSGNRPERSPTRILDDAGIKEIAAIPGVAYVEPSVNFNVFVRANGKLRTSFVGGANIPNSATRFQNFAAGKMISSPTAGEAVVSERFIREFGFEKPADAVGKTL